MKVVVKALPDWMLRREKRRSVAYEVGNVTSVPPCTLASEDAQDMRRLRSSVGRSLHRERFRFDTAFDDANVDSRKFIQSGRTGAQVLRVLWTRRCSLGDGAGLQGLGAKVVLLVVIDMNFKDPCKWGNGDFSVMNSIY